MIASCSHTASVTAAGPRPSDSPFLARTATHTRAVKTTKLSPLPEPWGTPWHLVYGHGCLTRIPMLGIALGANDGISFKSTGFGKSTGGAGLNDVLERSARGHW